MKCLLLERSSESGVIPGAGAIIFAASLLVAITVSDFKIAGEVMEHGYSNDFGIPSKIYDVDGVSVTIKNSKNGARYNLSEECGSCEYFPCNEGLYFISSLPDGRFSGCRFDKVHVATSNRREGLELIMKKLRGAELILCED